MTNKIYNVLFLCTANSARSIMAEGLLNKLGQGRFVGFSAGSYPGGKVNPLALEMLAEAQCPVENARSKSWDEFAQPDAPHMDIVITVCDNAAGEVCPVWPGRPATAHWSHPDPAATEGDDDKKRAAFATVFERIRRRLQRLVNLPVQQLDQAALQRELQLIAQSQP